MKKILLATTILLGLATAAKSSDWAHCAGVCMEPAHYIKQDPEPFPDYAHQWRDNVIQRITDDKWYGNPRNIDLLALLPPLKETEEQARLKELNGNVNKLFKYWSGTANHWLAIPPMLSVFLGHGDCKAYAYYKYWLLKQMGYKNVKLVTIVLPDGRGDLAGHVVVVLNDLWVLDINDPYYYPFEVLRRTSALNEAFFPDSSVWDVK